MRYFFICLVFFQLLHAKDDFQLSDVEIPRLSGMKAPEMREFPDGIQMAISTSSPEAQKHVLQGLNLIHSGWDFEAYRHFLAALKEDPDCLMAFFGMAFATQGDGDEFTKARITSIDRALALAEVKVGTELERGYVHGLHTLVKKGPAEAADAFASVAARFPNDPQLRLFESYFLRGGFSESGAPTASQESAQKRIEEYLTENPKSFLHRNAWLVIRAENPFPPAEDVTMARELVESMPDLPNFRHLLGHYEWRTGNFGAAAASFSQASELYRAWMKNGGLSVADCPEWIRSECYRAVAQCSYGKIDEGIQIAAELTKLPISVKDIGSAGTRMVAWEARTLMARICHRNLDAKMIEKALASLPKPDVANPLAKQTKVGSLYQALNLYFEGMKSVTEGNTQRAEEISQMMNLHGTQMVNLRKDAIQLGEISHFARAFRGMEILAAELKGNAVMKKNTKESTAYNWYSGAADRQIPSTRLMPPLFLLPMQLKVAQYYAELKNYNEVVIACDDGLKIWPNDLLLLEAKRSALINKGDTAGALAVMLKIQAIKTKK